MQGTHKLAHTTAGNAPVLIWAFHSAAHGLCVLSENLRRSTSTLLSFIALAIAIAYGVLAVFAYERNESDWGLFSAFGGLLISLLVGSAVVVLFSIYAFIRREKMAAFSLLISIPSLCFILWAGFGYVSYAQERDHKREEKELSVFHRERLLSVPGTLRDEEWPNDDSPRGRALRGVLWNSEGEFSKGDFLGLAEKDPSWLETMYYHSDCPQILLREGFTNYNAMPDRIPLSASFRQILGNPNSPIEFVKEVSEWGGLSETEQWTVNRMLEARLKKQGTESGPRD